MNLLKPLQLLMVALVHNAPVVSLELAQESFGELDDSTSLTSALRGMAQHFSPSLLDEAICYAERYPDLLQGFCQGDTNRCVVADLWNHFEEHGKGSNLLWGCRKRVTEHAIPSANAHLVQSDQSESNAPTEVHFLIFETSDGNDEETALIEQSVAAGIRTTRIGRGATFEGFSTKWQVILSYLKSLSVTSDTLMVITDARDVLLNVHDDYLNQEEITEHMTSNFIRAYNALTYTAPGAIVMSAEAQCCVAALTFAKPGSYFDEDGRRSQRACASGKEGCMWGGDSNVVVWEDFQINLAYNRTGRHVQDVYLNAGLAAGRVADWIRLLEAADLEEYEDDQAVFTEYMYHRPDQIVLDYASEMFGTARWPVGMNEKGCPFGDAIANKRNQQGRFPALRHLESKSMPLLLHTPGKFFACYEYMAQELGLTENVISVGQGELSTQRRLKGGKDDKKQQQQTVDSIQHIAKEDKKQQQAQTSTTLPPKQPKGQKNIQQGGTTVQKKKKKNKQKQKQKQKTKIPENYVVRVRGLRTLN